LKLINRKVITPSPAEVSLNPRSRSAKLRAAERITTRGDAYASAEDHAFITIARSTGWRKPALIKKIKMAFIAA
jgi:16S rRNA (cytosine1402-N4)-methyltransferase